LPPQALTPISAAPASNAIPILLLIRLKILLPAHAVPSEHLTGLVGRVTRLHGLCDETATEPQVPRRAFSGCDP
jgi:hypothetical protein